jgi:tripartite-type tricarboxylate transporter receptor subunit TctC
MSVIRYSLVAVCISTACHSLVNAQSYPAAGKPIRIVVPTAPSGGNDFMARVISQKLTERFKQSVIVDNKAGGNGAIGSETIARATPDGYNLLFGYIATHAINPALQKLAYDPVRDFAPITQVAEAQNALVVHPSLRVQTVKDLIALARTKGNALSYASAGNGTAPHVAGEMFRHMTGAQFVHVPYKGSGPAVTDTIGGHTQVMFPSLIAAAQHIKSGRLTGLAVTGKKRSTLFPTLPTVAEGGVPGFEVVQWYGMFAPAKTPFEVVNKLNAEIIAVLKDPSVTSRFAEQGAEIVTATPDEFARFVLAEQGRWKKFVETVQLKAD